MINGHTTVVVGVYASVDDARRGVDELIAARLCNSELSLLMALRMPPGIAFDPALSISDVGAFVGAGPIVAALAELVSHAATALIAGALVRVGFLHAEAIRFEDHLRDGAVIVGAHCEALDETARAQHILKTSGAKDISAAGRDIVAAPRHRGGH